MEVLTSLLQGFAIAVTPTNLLFALAGCVLGTLIGALPGFGPPAGVAILLPFTFNMPPVTGLIMLAGVYYGAMYGGTITSVLLNIPGESSSVMTAIDGYKMAQQGRAGVALGIAAVGSFVAGTVGVVLLMTLGPLVAQAAIKFGPPEYFALMVLGLATISGLTGASTLRGLGSAMFGIFCAAVGVDIMSGQPRFQFGIRELYDGIEFLPVAVGLFGVSEVFENVMKRADFAQVQGVIRWREVMPSWKDWKAAQGSIWRGSFLGFATGVLPGAGATVASFFSYALEKKLSKHPEEFGQGAIAGVAGPEAANNSASTGAFVPLLTLGVPGSGTTAVLLGALIMYGLRPGPLLFTDKPDIIWGLIASMYIGNVMLLVMNIAFIPTFIWMMRTSERYLNMLVAVLCIIGVYAQTVSLFDVGVTILFGFIGFLMRRLDYPAAPVVLALVLGPMAENTLRQSLLISDKGAMILLTRPVSLVLLAAAFLYVFGPLLYGAIRSRYRSPREA